MAGISCIISSESFLLFTDDNPLLDKHEDALRQIEVKASVIAKERPGLTIFSTHRYTCLFNNTLHPNHCGFSAESGLSYDKLISAFTTGR